MSSPDASGMAKNSAERAVGGGGEGLARPARRSRPGPFKGGPRPLRSGLPCRASGPAGPGGAPAPRAPLPAAFPPGQRGGGLPCPRNWSPGPAARFIPPDSWRGARALCRSWLRSSRDCNFGVLGSAFRAGREESSPGPRGRRWKGQAAPGRLGRFSGSCPEVLFRSSQWVTGRDFPPSRPGSAGLPAQPRLHPPLAAKG